MCLPKLLVAFLIAMIFQNKVCVCLWISGRNILMFERWCALLSSSFFFFFFFCCCFFFFLKREKPLAITGIFIVSLSQKSFKICLTWFTEFAYDFLTWFLKLASKISLVWFFFILIYSLSLFRILSLISCATDIRVDFSRIRLDGKHSWENFSSMGDVCPKFLNLFVKIGFYEWFLLHLHFNFDFWRSTFWKRKALRGFYFSVTGSIDV